MGKVFEDYFTEIQADMVSVCLEYVEERAEKIYIYCSFENNVLSSGFFFKVNGKIVKKSNLNDVLSTGEKEYDVSMQRQKGAIDIINNDIKSLIRLCKEYRKEMPTQIKLTYDVRLNKLNADYSYDLIYSNHKTKTAYDVLEEWILLEKGIEEGSDSIVKEDRKKQHWGERFRRTWEKLKNSTKAF